MCLEMNEGGRCFSMPAHCFSFLSFFFVRSKHRNNHNKGYDNLSRRTETGKPVTRLDEWAEGLCDGIDYYGSSRKGMRIFPENEIKWAIWGWIWTNGGQGQ